jgi:hypothetical protein
MRPQRQARTLNIAEARDVLPRKIAQAELAANTRPAIK